MIDFLNDESLVITYKTEFQLNENDFVKKSEETDKQNEKKSQEKKYFNVFLHFMGGTVGTFDKDEMLEALDYKDLDELWEEYGTGLVGECDDYQSFIYKVQSVYVEECKTKLENPFLTDSDANGDEYDEGFDIEYFEIPQKGCGGDFRSDQRGREDHAVPSGDLVSLYHRRYGTYLGRRRR